MRDIERLFRLVGHRGAAALAPENTLPSFAKAYECGATAIEFDVRLTRDSVPVIFHDESLERLTGVEARLRDLSFRELRELKVLGEAQVPTLEEVLEFASGKLAVDVELKEPGAEKEVVRLLGRYCLEEESLITSFFPEILSRVRELAPDLRLGVLLERWDEKYLDIARRVGAHAILPNYTSLTPDVVDTIKREGFALIVWTVNDPRDAARLLRQGVDGIITDDPYRLRSVVRQL